MAFRAAILMSVLVVVFSGTINVPKKDCHCRTNDTLYTNGLCLRPLQCKNSQQLPLMSDRKLGTRIVVYNQKVYRTYPAVARQSKRCTVAGTLYNKKFDVCVRLLKCFEKVFGVSNGSISKKYYVQDNKLYQSYPPYCQ